MVNVEVLNVLLLRAARNSQNQKVFHKDFMNSSHKNAISSAL